MTKSTITREQLLEIIETDHVQCGEASYLARMALAAMDSEPVALQPELAKVIYHFRDWNEGFPVERFKADYVISWMLANYPPAQPAPVVPVTDAMAYAFHHALTDSPLGDDDVEDIKAGLRAALVNVFNTQPPPQEVHDEK